MNTELAKGDTVIFKGFPEDLPDNPPLVKGEQYEIQGVDKDEDGVFYTVHVEDKGEVVAVDVYGDEVEVPGEEEDETTGLEFADVVKGMTLKVEDVGGNSYSGEVFKKTKTLIGIRHDGAEISVRAKDITSIAELPEGTETVEKTEEKAAKPKKKVTKKKVAKKAAAKKAIANKAKSKLPARTEAAETDEELKDMLILDRSEEDADILELVEGADDILELAQEFAEEAANMDYQLGGILYHVRVSKKFKDIKPEYAERGGFGKYTEEQLGMHYRKCMYLIDIYSTWNKYNLPKNWISEQGWSKALLVARHVDDENAEDLMAVAEEQSVADLRETIKESYARKGADTREIIKKITFKFRLLEEPASMITDYMELAMKQLGLDKPEEVFEHVFTEWAQEHLDVGKRRRKTVAKDETKGEGKAGAKPRTRKKKQVKQEAAA